MDWVLVAVTACLAIAAIAVWYTRRPREAPPPAPPQGPQEDIGARRARRQAAEHLGSQLIERRLDLESRRGTVGDDAILDALDRLEERVRRGEISEQEFETEKVRLLGG